MSRVNINKVRVIIRKQCKQLMFNMHFIAELFAEIAEKDERIKRLEDRFCRVRKKS